MNHAKYRHLESNANDQKLFTQTNFLSRLTFWWMNGIFRIGNERQIENEDLFSLPHSDLSESMTNRLRKIGTDQSRTGTHSRRLFWDLVRMLPVEEYLLIIILGLFSIICNICQPFCLGMSLSILLGLPGSNGDYLFVYATALSTSAFLQSFVMHHFVFRCRLIAMKWRTATMGLMFQKVGAV